MAIVAIGGMGDVINEMGSNISGCGKWILPWIGKKSTPTMIVALAYCTCISCGTFQLKTMWTQSSQYYQSVGDFHSPLIIFMDDLLCMLYQWIPKGVNVILSIDANQDVYNSTLAPQLAKWPEHMLLGQEVSRWCSASVTWLKILIPVNHFWDARVTPRSQGGAPSLL